MFLVQNSARNQSKPKQSHGHCVRCEVIKTGSPQNNHRQHHEYNNYSSLEYDRRWRISPLFFQFSYHIFGQLSRINKQLVANHAIVLVKQTTLFEYETPVTTCRFTNSCVTKIAMERFAHAFLFLIRSPIITINNPMGYGFLFLVNLVPLVPSSSHLFPSDSP